MRALRRQPAAAVRVAEALAVLFADLHEQNGRAFTRLRTLKSLSEDGFFFVLGLGKLLMPVQRFRKDSITTVCEDKQNKKHVLFSGGGSGR